MTVPWLATGLALAVLAYQGDDRAPVADGVILRDGRVLLGQVEGVDRFGVTNVVVARAWAAANLPDLLPSWERAEADLDRRVRLLRRERLYEWRRLRAANAPAGDPVLPWLDREGLRVSDPRPPRTELMRVAIGRGDVRGMNRREAADGRLLRLGWLARLGGVETMPRGNLRDALAARDASRAPNDPAWVDGLLPLRAETEAQWRTRRAATEVLIESDLRFVRFRQFLLPESGAVPDTSNPGSTTTLLDSSAAQDAYRSILRVAPEDPVQRRLNELAARGRIGAVVSRVEFSSDLNGAEADTALWVRQEDGTWGRVLPHVSRVRVDDPPDSHGTAAPAIYLPLRGTLHVLELFSAASSTPVAVRERDAAAGAAQRALGRARAELDRDLAPYLLPPAADPLAYRNGAPR